MKTNDFVIETSASAITKSYLYEGLDRASLRSVKLWESAGHKILEAELTPQQIEQLFAQAEQGATAAGGNRTLVGKGVDVASAVNKAWEDLKTKVQNSGPIQNIDATYDAAAEKLKQATGGDAGVMKYVQKYRDFAKKHPVAQSFIYAALIAAAGISGAGLGGAAALGLFKMTDKLLQGEKFSSAAYAGAKTGATAYAAGQVGKALQGGDQAGATQAAGQTANGLTRMNVDAWQANPYYAKELARGLNDPNVSQAWKDQFIAQLNRTVANPSDNASLSTAWQSAMKATTLKVGNPYESVEITGVALTESQVRVIFNMVNGLPVQLNEGPMDWIKGAAGKVANAGHNLTTKVTADKLRDAWKKAGSPTDSEAIAGILTNAGVAPETVNSVFTQMQIPAPSAAQQAPTAQPAADQTQQPATQQATGTDQTPQADAQAQPKQGGILSKIGQGISGAVAGYKQSQQQRAGQEKTSNVTDEVLRRWNEKLGQLQQAGKAPSAADVEAVLKSVNATAGGEIPADLNNAVAMKDFFTKSVAGAMAGGTPQQEPATGASPAGATTTTDTTTAEPAATTAEPTAAPAKLDVTKNLNDILAHVEAGGSVTPAQRGILKDLWMRTGGTKIESKTTTKKKV